MIGDSQARAALGKRVRESARHLKKRCPVSRAGPETLTVDMAARLLGMSTCNQERPVINLGYSLD